MSLIEQPMLAIPLENGKLKFPLWGTPKFDGIRCLKINGTAVTRKFLPISNQRTRKWIEDLLPDDVDGELLIPKATFSESSGEARKRTGKELHYYIFDYVKTDIGKPYIERINDLCNLHISDPRVHIVVPVELKSMDDLLEYETYCLSNGYEGAIIRPGDSPYRFGRCTPNESYMLKVKRFIDAEAIVVGFTEQMTNANPREFDNFGYTKRSKNSSNLIPVGKLGALLVKDLKKNFEFYIGAGFTDSERIEIFSNRNAYLGKIVKYKYQPEGMKNLPRCPVFLGFRDPSDM